MITHLGSSLSFMFWSEGQMDPAERVLEGGTFKDPWMSFLFYRFTFSDDGI
jgi:hypothetical protein